MFDTLDLPLIAGMIGAGGYCLNYFLIAFGIMNSRCRTYYLINFLSASLVAVSLTAYFNLATLVIQSFFMMVSMIGFYRCTKRRCVSEF